MAQKLYLHQELILLALRDDKGTFSAGMFIYAVAGAMVSELLLQEKIAATDDKKQFVSVVDASPLSDPILNELLQKIRESAKPKSLQHWVSSAAHLAKLRHRIAQQLCDMGILKEDEKKILWLFTQKVYPELDGSYEDAIRIKMANVMFHPDAKPDSKTLVLISLAHHTDLLKPNFAPEELRQHKKHIKELANGDILATGATGAAIQAIQTAIMVATIIPAIAATTAATH